MLQSVFTLDATYICADVTVCDLAPAEDTLFNKSC